MGGGGGEGGGEGGVGGWKGGKEEEGHNMFWGSFNFGAWKFCYSEEGAENICTL